MIKIKIEISNEGIDRRAAGIWEDYRRWALDDNATIETFVNRIISDKYLPQNKNFVEGYTLFINNKEIFYINKSLSKIDYFCDKNENLKDFVSDNSIICAKFIIKTNTMYNILKSVSDSKFAKHKQKLEKTKETYAKQFKDADKETIYNKIIELNYNDKSYENLSEIVYVFSNALIGKTEINVEKYIDAMLEELYLIIFDKNTFNKLIKEKYSWLSDKNKKLIEIHLRYAAK